MSDRHPLLARAAVFVGALATLRIGLFAFVDKSPRYGGEEANALRLLMQYHLPFRYPWESGTGPNFESLRHVIRGEFSQPPLWYVSLAGMFSQSESLTYGPVLLTNAAALGLALWAAWRFGGQLGSPRTGLLAVIILACLPLVAGRVTLVGAEPWQLALIGVSLGLLLRLRRPDSSRRQALLLGAVTAAGMLVKLTFVACLLGPLLLELITAVRAGPSGRLWRRRLYQAGAAGLVLGCLGWLPFTDLSRLGEAYGNEPTHAALFSFASWDLFLFWIKHAGGWGAGPFGGGLPLVLLALLGAGLSRWWTRPAPDLGCRPAFLLASSVVSLLFVHALIPHQEIRYLLPAAFGLSLLLAMGIAPFWSWGLQGRIAVVLVLLGLGRATLVEVGYEEVRLQLDPWDHGIEALLCHESLEREGGARVLLAIPRVRNPVNRRLDGRLRDTIEWEMYSRNRKPVVSVGALPNLVGPLAGELLRLSSHMVTNQQLQNAEVQLLEQYGFTELTVVPLALPPLSLEGVPLEPTPWSLWGRAPARPRGGQQQP